MPPPLFAVNASAVRVALEGLKHYQRFAIEHQEMRVTWQKKEQKVFFETKVSGRVKRPGKSLYFAMFDGFALKRVSGKGVQSFTIKRPFPFLPGYLVRVRFQKALAAGDSALLTFVYETRKKKTLLYTISPREALFQSFFYPVVDDTPFDALIEVKLPEKTAVLLDGKAQVIQKKRSVRGSLRGVTFLEMGFGEWQKKKIVSNKNVFIFYGTKRTAKAFPFFAAYLSIGFREYEKLIGFPPPCQPLKVLLPETLALRPHMARKLMALSSRDFERFQKGAGSLFPLMELFLHEIGHCYFGMGVGRFMDLKGGMWLIEGMAQYAQLMLQEKRYAGLLSFRQIARAEVQKMQDQKFASRILEEAMYMGDEGVMYYKGALILRFLFSFLTAAQRQEVLQSAYRASQGKLLNGRRFQEIVEEVTGHDFSFFFKRFVFGQEVLDVKMAEVVPEERAFSITGIQELARDALKSGIHFALPVAFELISGKIIRKKLNAPFDRKLFPPATVCIELDPDFVFPDVDRSNNRYCLKKDL